MDHWSKKILIGILCVGFLIRIVGINYGLPLWLVGDEPPFIFGALKMIELKNPFPLFHQPEFKNIFYFGPYLAYLYLVPFISLLAIKFVSFSGTASEFRQFLLSDLSSFFLIARVISVIFGTLTVWALYKTVFNIFRNKIVALASASFLAFSTMHVLLSHWGRDWTVAVFFFVLALYFLTKHEMPDMQRYHYAAIVAGIAFGVSIIAIFIPILITLWILIYEKKSLQNILLNKHVWLIIFSFFALAAFSMVIHPGGFFFSNANSLTTPKSLRELADVYISFIKPIAGNDPLLLIWSLVGLAKIWVSLRNLFWVIFSFVNIYIFTFFVSFHTDDRFAIYLYPILAILAGYGFWALWENKKMPNFTAVSLGIVSLISMLVINIRLDFVLLRNDTRAQAREWIETHIPPEEKIIVLAPLTRLSATPKVIEEQESLDASSLRTIDIAEKSLSKRHFTRPRYHTLNLYTTSTEASYFYNNFAEYIATRHYRYALASENSFKDTLKNSAQTTISRTGKPIQVFPGIPLRTLDLTEGSIGNLNLLFTMPANGPRMVFYELKQESQ